MAGEFLARGDLVPDSVMLEVISLRLEEADCRSGVRRFTGMTFSIPKVFFCEKSAKKSRHRCRVLSPVGG